MPSSNILTRDDTLFGVCQALGEDLGFNPLYLRVVLAVGLLWNPLAMLGAYAAAGVLVAFTRWVAPVPRAAEVIEAAQVPAPAEAETDMALAA